MGLFDFADSIFGGRHDRFRSWSDKSRSIGARCCPDIAKLSSDLCVFLYDDRARSCRERLTEICKLDSNPARFTWSDLRYLSHHCRHAWLWPALSLQP